MLTLFPPLLAILIKRWFKYTTFSSFENKLSKKTLVSTSESVGVKFFWLSLLGCFTYTESMAILVQIIIRVVDNVLSTTSSYRGQKKNWI